MIEKPSSNYSFNFKTGSLEVHLSNSLIGQLSRLSKSALPNETGGTLLGYYNDSMKIANITEILKSAGKPKSTPTSFIRPSDTKETESNRRILASRGRLFYLGEWHSHPKGPPYPSPNDLMSCFELVKYSRVPTETPIMLIIGNDLSANVNNMACCLLVAKKGACEIQRAERINEPIPLKNQRKLRLFTNVKLRKKLHL